MAQLVLHEDEIRRPIRSSCSSVVGLLRVISTYCVGAWCFMITIFTFHCEMDANLYVFHRLISLHFSFAT